MAVSSKERARARRQARETAAFERISISSASRLGFRMLSRSLTAFRQNRTLDITKIVQQEYEKILPILVEMMTLGYLTGLDRVKQGQGEVLQAALHPEAVRALFKRLQIDPARLAEVSDRMNAQAVRVLDRSSAALDKSLQRSIIKSTQEGLTTREGTRALRNTFAKNGVVPVNSFEVEAVFRTQTQFAYSSGTWSAAQDPAVDEILWGYKYVTVGDDRVRDEHQRLDGTTAPKDAGIWQSIWPPNGWACRCQIIFLFEPEPIDLPSAGEIDGRIVQPVPDPGFDFNPGTVFLPGKQSVRKPSAVGKRPARVKVPKSTPPVEPPLPLEPVAVSRWMNVKSLDEATEALGIDVKKAKAVTTKRALPVVNALGKEQTRLIRSHPKLAKVEISEIRIERGQLTRMRAAAGYEHDFKAILIHADSAGPTSAATQKAMNALRRPGITAHDTTNLYRHEFGHAVQDQLLTAKNKATLNREFLNVDADLLKDQVSQYAATKPEEAFSELFNLIAGERTGGLTVMPETRRIIEGLLK